MKFCDYYSFEYAAKKDRKELPLLKIETDGAGTFTRTVKFDVQMQNLAARHWRGITPAGSDQICWYAKTFLLNEKNTGTAGWDYSKTKYALTFWYDVGTEELELEIHEPGNDVYFSEAAFTNTYTCNESHYEIPFTKTVTLGGSAAPGRETFELEIFDPGVSSLTYFDDLYTASVQIDGAGSYNGILTISGPADRVEALTCEGFYVREKDTGAKNWTYSDAVWHVVPKWSLNGNDRQFATYPTSLERSPDGYEYYEENRTPSDRMTFQNTYTYTPAVSRCEIPFTKIVTADGSADPGRQDFELEIFDPGVSSLTDFDDLYTAVVETDGAGSYNGTLTISGPEDQVEALVCEGFYVREKDTGAANWIYSDAVWHIVPDYRTEDTRVLTIYPTVMERSENGYYYMDTETPASMTFKNTFVGSTHAITVKNSTYGDVTASHTSASKDTTITLTAKPDQGYMLDTLTVLDSQDKEIKLTEKNGKFTFAIDIVCCYREIGRRNSTFCISLLSSCYFIAFYRINCYSTFALELIVVVIKTNNCRNSVSSTQLMILIFICVKNRSILDDFLASIKVCGNYLELRSIEGLSFYKIPYL